jgi:hypothetical protein
MSDDRPITDFEIVESMRLRGGHFAAALAEACHRADDENFLKIKATWPEMFAEHREAVRVRRARAAEQAAHERIDANMAALHRSHADLQRSRDQIKAMRDRIDQGGTE